MTVLNSFLNPWMLAGLAGLLLPVIAHLLSRKKYDQVDWGAMQFLELDPRARRHIRLEELLLLLVRMGLVALLVVAFARPWIGGAWLGGMASTEPRDVVLVIDGSYSMDWDSQPASPRVQSLQLARQFLNELRSSDTIQIIDAREQPRLLLPEPVRDIYRARETLNELPAPSGTADLAAAVKRAVQILSVGTNLHREVVVFTDLQAYGWKADDPAWWSRFDDTRSQLPVSPRIWVVDAAQGELGHAANFTIERIQLSREMAVRGLPIKIASKVKYSGGDAPFTRKVYLEIDQQRLNDQTVQLKLTPEGETSVDFEYRFESPGTHLISLVLDNDALPGDNRADAVVTVAESLPVLLIDGDHRPDPTKSETYFAKAALLATGDDHPWIKATVITPDEFTIERLKPMSVAVVANVETLNESVIEALRQFAISCHGVLFTLGDKVDKDRYREMLFKAGAELFPCRLESLAAEETNEKRGVRIASNSLELSWLRPFRADQGGTLSDARWSRWWKVAVPDLPVRSSGPPTAKNDLTDDELVVQTDAAHESPLVGNAVVEARLTNGDPLLIARRFGRGTTAVLTSSLDADWNTLPAKQDYVPFLHELLFSLASPTTSRNTEVGSPLLLVVPANLKIGEFQFLTPTNESLPAEKLDDPFQPMVRLRTTALPGVYRFIRKSPLPNELNRPEYFAVNFDRAESNVTPLTLAQREFLSDQDRLKFIADLLDLRQNMFAEDSRAEFWWLLLYVFLGSLAIETWMTRRMVRGGYSDGA